MSPRRDPERREGSVWQAGFFALLRMAVPCCFHWNSRDSILAVKMSAHHEAAMLTEHEIEIRVRYQETDGQARLHHSNYFNYFEMGRTELLRAAGYTYKDLEASGYMLVVADISCRYFVPAAYDDV